MESKVVTNAGMYTKKSYRFLFKTYQCVYFDDYKIEFGCHGFFSMGIGHSYIMYKRVNGLFGKRWKGVAFTYPQTHGDSATFEDIKNYLLWFEFDGRRRSNNPFNPFKGL